MTWFKVTRPNGESFHTPDVVYKAGKRVRPLPSTKRVMCREGLLHASPSAPEAATYGKWPYILWRVEGKPYITQDNKAGFKQLTVIEQLDVAECFGPPGSHIVALLERISTLDTTDVGKLSAARSAGWRAAGYAAGYAAEDAARSAGWRAARSAAGYAAEDVAWDAAGYAARDTAGGAAWYAAGGAARALSCRDLIGPTFTQEHYDILTRTWRTAIGPIHPEDAE